MSQFQGSVNSSAMFLTAAAQNLLCMKLATELGVVIPSPWLTWFKAAVLPAALGLLITPFLLYKASAGSTGRRASQGCCQAVVLAVVLLLVLSAMFVSDIVHLSLLTALHQSLMFHQRQGWPGDSGMPCHV
jgi:di/tricarboxylate transporter